MRKLFIIAFLLILPFRGIVQSKVLVIKNIAVVDVEKGKVKYQQTVIITNNKITEVKKKVSVPITATVIDGEGKYLIPGLWDMHVHVLSSDNYKWAFPMMISNGVTGIRELGNNMPFEKIKQVRREILEGTILGPRIGAATGKILEAVASELFLAVTTPQQARQIVRDYKQGGADFIKPYNQLSREVYLALVEEAKLQNIPVEGHVPFSMTPEEVSDLGQKIIEHNFGVLVFCSRHATELQSQTQAQPAIWGRFEAEAARSYDKQKAHNLYKQFVRNGTWSCPTIITYRPLRFSSDSALMQDSLLKYLPKPVRDRWHETFMQRVTRNVPDASARKIRDEMRITIVGDMHRIGVRLLAGTDMANAYTFPGFSLHEELMLLTEAGLSPAEALRTATINPALFLGKDKELGTVEKGKVADLVLLDANPLESISNTKKIYAVITNGRLFKKKDLDKLLIQVEEHAKSND